MRPPARNGLAVLFFVSALAAPFCALADDTSPAEEFPFSENSTPTEQIASSTEEASTSTEEAPQAVGASSSPGDSIFRITDSLTGGDCIKIGVWVPDQRTCILGHDIQGQIIIATSSVTLDGSSFTLSSDQDRTPYPLISITNQERVNVRYIAISGADTGILFDHDVIGRANGITFTRTRTGVDIRNNDGTYVENSNDVGTDAHANTVGVRITDSNGTHIAGNRFVGLGTGILVSGAFEYTLQQNTVTDSGIGFDIASSSGASIWQNFFYRNPVAARATDDSTGRFFAPGLGGNHWDAYDQPSEGCDDVNGDGFCDRAYIVNHSEQLFDNLPYATTTPDATTTCFSHCLSSVLFIPGTETSRLYMRDLFGVEHELWEPSLRPDVPLLTMNPDGTSKHEVYTKDIIDTYYGNDPSKSAILGALGKSGMVYGDFEKFMDGLVATGTVASWLPYPYDWRHDIRDIVDHGTLTEQLDGTLKQVYLEDLVESLASSASTTSHKVTIVAHSNGGLIAKALLEKLAADGKSDLVDKLIMIGTPQWGTPKDIGSMLHGDDMTVMGGIIMYGGDVREVAQGMPGPYDLLPSREYFSQIHSPVATFAISDDAASAFGNTYPAGIRSLSDLLSFVTDSLGFDVNVGSASNLNTPLALRSDLFAAATSLHDDLDHWTPPPDVSVTSIVGWGQLTPSGYSYASTPEHLECEGIFGTLCSRKNALLHTEILTEDGDGTVVSPSAAADTGNVRYFNAKDYTHNAKVSIFHQYLTSAAPIQNLLIDLLGGSATSTEGYILSKAPTAEVGPLVRVSALSPVNLVATDAGGNETGVVPIPGKPDIYFEKQDIPGSSVQVAGEEKFIYLPAGSQYTVSVRGYAYGDANIRVENLDEGGTVTLVTTLADVPATVNTTALFSTSGADSTSFLSVDENGDGSVDKTITPDPGNLISYRAIEEDTSDGSSTDLANDSTPDSTAHHSSKRPENLVLLPAIPAIPATPQIPVPFAAAPTLHAATADVPIIASATTRTALPYLTSSAPSRAGAAYAALSPSVPSALILQLYHWVYTAWLALLHELYKFI